MKSKANRALRALTLSAMLVAMSVAIGIFCKTFLNLGGGIFRITFENLPIILSGMLFGPVVGAVVGAASDLVSYLLSPQIYPPNLVVTLGAAIIGATSGLAARVTKAHSRRVQVTVAVALSHVIGSMTVKSFGLFSFFGWAVLFRIPTYIAIGAVEGIVLCLLFRNRTFSSLAEDIEEIRK